MNIHIPLRRQALAGALVLTLVAACLPAAPLQPPTAAPNLNFAPTLPAPTAASANAAPTPVVAVPTTAVGPTAGAAPAATVAYTKAASDLSQLPDPLAGWQAGDRSVPITITEYGDFQ
jgi:FtsP/CotA-like multicopper oxidase with cupredoxin domain